MDVLKHLQTSVAQSFDGSFDNAYRRLNTELALRDAKVKEAEGRAKLADEARISALAKIEELERDISVLRAELKQYEVDSKKLEASVITPEELHETYAPGRVFDFHESSTDGGRNSDLLMLEKGIESKYRALYSDARTLVEAYGDLRMQLRRQKNKLVQWRDCIGRDEFTFVLDEGVIVKFRRVQGIANGRSYKDKIQPRTSEPSDTIEQKAAAEASTRIRSPAIRPVPEGICTALKTNTENGTDNGRSHLPCAGQFDLASTQPGNLSVPDEDATLNHSSDAPVAQVKHRCKRKRTSLLEFPPTSSYRRDNARNDNSELPAVIKSDSTPSSPLQNFPRYRTLNPAGTQDLDKIGVTVQTPTKRAINACPRPLLTPSMPVPTSDLNGHRYSNRYQQSPLEQMLPKQSMVLQPVDINTRAANPSGRKSDAKKKKVQAIPLITEDGDESYLSLGTTDATGQRVPNIQLEQPVSTVDHSSVHRRLESLLDGPSPSRSPLTSLKNPTGPIDVNNLSRIPDGLTGRNSLTKRTGGTPDNAGRRPGSLQTMETPVVKNDLDDAYEPSPFHFNNSELPEVLPEDEPYRAWPIYRLTFGCFKINPARNQGVDFPHKSVVRKRDERKCLPGCVSENCCGPKLRDLARSLPWDEEEAQRILEEYLGEERHLLGRMSDEERDKALLDAKTWSLANQHGRHRHNHQRPPSPPGFWRTEMPDTQELEHDREEAKRLERQMIIERRREAMRPGGLWKFADE